MELSPTLAGDLTVAEQVLDAVVPQLTKRRTVTVKALPEIRLGTLRRDGSMLYGLATLDDHGRLADRHLLRALGWSAGQRIDLTVSSGTIIARGDQDGQSVLTAKGFVHIPVRIRRWCSLSMGERVLLVALPSHDIMMIHSPSILDAMVVNYHTSVTDSDDG